MHTLSGGMPHHCHAICLTFTSVFAALKWGNMKSSCACVLDNDKYQTEKTLDLLLDVPVPRSSAE